MKIFTKYVNGLSMYTLVSAFFAALTLTACAGQTAVEPPVVSDPQISAPTPQEPGQEIGISVDVSSVSGVSLTYDWRADGGEIVRGQNSPAITYRTPDEPGIYNVRVAVKWGDSSIEKITTIRVEAPEVAAVDEPPPDTPTPKVEEVPPTATPVPPTATRKPTNTPERPTDTPAPEPTELPPTNTPLPPAPLPTEVVPLPSEITSERGKLIQNRGTIVIGIREYDLYPITFLENNDYQGFEVELAREIVRRRFGNNVTIEWLRLPAAERFEAVRANRIDFLIRNTTHTVFRENLVAFTDNYFWDGIRLLVRRDLGITGGIEYMNGGTIVVPDYTTTNNTTAEEVVRQAAAAAGVEVNLIVDNDPATFFNEGRADAVAMDWQVHGMYTNDYSTHQAIGKLLSSEPIAIAVSLNDPVFRDEINTTLLEIIADGSWRRIYDRWFPEPPPWTTEEMLAVPPPPG